MPFVMLAPNAPITRAGDRIRSANHMGSPAAYSVCIVSVSKAAPVSCVLPNPDAAHVQISPRPPEF
jgi:hypothetical protein